MGEIIMLCDICKKNEATIHIKEFSSNNSEKKILNLCSSCAAQQEKSNIFNLGGFNLAEILFNLGKLDLHSADVDNQQTQNSTPVCPGCGWTLQQIHNSSGRMGCAKCYSTFRHLIAEAIDNVHRGTIHIGKRPKGGTSNDQALIMAELNKRQQELQTLIKNESYEQAAIVRDRIKELEAHLRNDKEVQHDV